MPEDNIAGSRLPDPDPEPLQALDSFAVYEAARRLRARTLRRMVARVFRRRAPARAVPTADAGNAPAPRPQRAAAADRREAA